MRHMWSTTTSRSRRRSSTTWQLSAGVVACPYVTAKNSPNTNTPRLNADSQWPYIRNFRHDKRMHMIKTTGHRYIVSDDQILNGESTIQGTRTPVRAIVEMWRLGVLPEEIPCHLPHLTLAQVFDALSYYSAHQNEINAYIEANRVPDELIDPLVKD